MTSIVSRGRHALVDSNNDACRNGIVDIIRMATDVLRIIREDYRLPPSVQPPVFSDLPSMQPPTFLVQLPTFSNSPLAEPPTFSNPPSVQPYIFLVQPPSRTFLDSPLVQPPIFSNPSSVQLSTFSGPPSESIPVLIATVISTQLDLSPIVPRGRRGLRRPRLLPPPPLFPVPSHVIPATVRQERPKRKRVPVIHKFSPCGGI